MLYFRNVVAAVAASFALTVLACTGIRSFPYSLFVPYYAIVPSVVAFYCLNENE